MNPPCFPVILIEIYWKQFQLEFTRNNNWKTYFGHFKTFVLQFRKKLKMLWNSITNKIASPLRLILTRYKFESLLKFAKYKHISNSVKRLLHSGIAQSHILRRFDATVNVYFRISFRMIS